MTAKVDFTIVNIGTLSMNKYWGETERKRTPTATCTLLQVQGINLIVDPSPYPQDLEKLLFANTGLMPQSVNMVFLTHFHADHRFGLELFPDAVWVMAQAGLDEWLLASSGDDTLVQRFQPAAKSLPHYFELMHSPGHTFGLHTLGVETQWGYLVVAGDAVMTYDYFRDVQGYRNSVDFDLAADTIRTIKSKATLVIPGHGNLILNFP